MSFIILKIHIIVIIITIIIMIITYSKETVLSSKFRNFQEQCVKYQCTHECGEHSLTQTCMCMCMCMCVCGYTCVYRLKANFQS